MKIELAKLMRMWSSLGSIRNRILNCVARFVSGKVVSIDWRDLKIVHPAAIKIGQNFSSGRGLWLESVDGKGLLTIGNNVNFSDHVHIGCANSVEIHDGVLIGSKVLITDHSHGETNVALNAITTIMPPNCRPIHSKGPVLIGKSVWLGDGVCVMAGVTIGCGAIVGANAVVVRDIPAETIWAGVPARQVWPKSDANNG